MTKTKIQIAQEELDAVNNQVNTARNKVANANVLCRRISWVDQECVKRLTLELQTKQQLAKEKAEEIQKLEEEEKKAAAEARVKALDLEAQSLFDKVFIVQTVTEDLKTKGYSIGEIEKSIVRLDLVKKEAEARVQALDLEAKGLFNDRHTVASISEILKQKGYFAVEIEQSIARLDLISKQDEIVAKILKEMMSEEDESGFGEEIEHTPETEKPIEPGGKTSIQDEDNTEL